VPSIQHRRASGFCSLPAALDLSDLTVVEPLPDYMAAMRFADAEAEKRLGEYVLLS